MSFTKMQARGQITIPRDVRKKLQLRPGDVLSLFVTGPETVEMRILPRRSFADLREQYRIDATAHEIDEFLRKGEWQAEARKDVFGQ
jgi:AbrB family looped-hinge helix DNA binding protein